MDYVLAKSRMTRRKNRVYSASLLPKKTNLGKIKGMVYIIGLLCIPLLSVAQGPTMSYVRESLPIIQEATTTLPTKETIIKEKINTYSKKYDVSETELHGIIACESQYDTNAHNKTAKEDSWGLVQINRVVHDVTVEQATDPDFAIDFLAKNVKKGKYSMWYTCSKRLGLI